MRRKFGRSTRVILFPAFMLFASLAFTMGGCKLSCESDDRSKAEKIIDDIGDEVQDTVKEIKDNE